MSNVFTVKETSKGNSHADILPGFRSDKNTLIFTLALIVHMSLVDTVYGFY